MNQKRIVLAPELIATADAICKQTGISTHSQLISILIKNYGDKLVSALRQ